MEKLNQNTSTLEQILDAVNELPEIDKSKQLITTVTGDGFVHLDDVSEVPHDITIEAAEGTKVSVAKGENHIPFPYYFESGSANNGITFTYKGNGIITANGTSTSSAKAYFTNPNTYINLEAGTYTISLKSTGLPSSACLCCYIPNYAEVYEKAPKTFTLETRSKFHVYLWIPSGKTLNNVNIYVQLAKGNGTIEYLEVIAPTTVKSNSPVMDFIADSSLTISYNKSWGMNEEHNRFWNGVFSGGNWQSKFVGSVWNDKTFRPNQDIKPTNSANNLFSLCEITDLCKILNDCGVVLDTSGITVRSDNMFNYAIYLTTVPFLDLRNANYSNSGIMRDMFTNCYELKSIEGIHLAEDGSQVLGNYAFNQCKKLEEVRFYGTIGSNGIDFQHSTKLSRASIESVVNALSSTTSGLTVTFSKTAVNSAFTTAEWNALAATKSNWTISLV